MKKAVSVFITFIFACFSLIARDPSPNIVWIIVEDMSPHFGYNGENLILTPNVDRMAEEGVNFTRAYVTAPVCSASRSALITGMYQTSIGAQNHRSSNGIIEIHLPDYVKTIPEYFRDAGYYVSNQYLEFGRWTRPGKEDYNFVYKTEDLYNGIDWSGRNEGQPFFAQIHLRGGKHRNIELDEMVDPDKVVLPPHYPDDPVLRKDWAEYLNSVKNVDMQVGTIFKRLEEEGVLENTVVFFITDHGISHARGKQFCYEEGAHIPMIVWGKNYVGQGVRDDLVSHIDLAASSLYLAGIEIPDYMEARPLFGKDASPRDYVITARDRCDETVDHIRSVRKGDYLYIRNYLYKRPLLQPNAYKDKKDILVRLRELHEEGKLNSLQERVLFADERPYEELYNLKLDEYQYVNLASDKYLKPKLEEMRKILDAWEVNTKDQGKTIESEEVYLKEMEPILQSLAKTANSSDREKVLRENMDLMIKWAGEGK